MTDATEHRVAEAEQAQGDIETLLSLILELGGLEPERAARGGELAAALVMQRLRERGWHV